MRLGIYPGSFNPPHKGHKMVMDYLLNNHYVDKIIVVPTMNYWDKQNLIDINDRISMLKFYENDLIKIDSINNDCPYTIDLMSKLKKNYENDELFLIIGADNLINFDKWKDYQKLLKYKIIIMNRDDINVFKYINKYPDNKFIIISDFPYINISSSKIRKKIENGNLDKEIYDYIMKRHLY